MNLTIELADEKAAVPKAPRLGARWPDSWSWLAQIAEQFVQPVSIAHLQKKPIRKSGPVNLMRG